MVTLSSGGAARGLRVVETREAIAAGPGDDAAIPEDERHRARTERIANRRGAVRGDRGAAGRTRRHGCPVDGAIRANARRFDMQRTVLLERPVAVETGDAETGAGEECRIRLEADAGAAAGQLGHRDFGGVIDGRDGRSGLDRDGMLLRDGGGHKSGGSRDCECDELIHGNEHSSFFSGKSRVGVPGMETLSALMLSLLDSPLYTQTCSLSRV